MHALRSAKGPLWFPHWVLLLTLHANFNFVFFRKCGQVHPFTHKALMVQQKVGKEKKQSWTQFVTLSMWGSKQKAFDKWGYITWSLVCMCPHISWISTSHVSSENRCLPHRSTVVVRRSPVTSCGCMRVPMCQVSRFELLSQLLRCHRVLQLIVPLRWPQNELRSSPCPLELWPENLKAQEAGKYTSKKTELKQISIKWMTYHAHFDFRYYSKRRVQWSTCAAVKTGIFIFIHFIIWTVVTAIFCRKVSVQGTFPSTQTWKINRCSRADQET